MKKLFITIILFLSFLEGSYGQRLGIDSLTHLLNVEKKDTSKILLLVQLSRVYLEYKPDTSLIFARKALALSVEKKFDKGEAMSLKAIGSTLGVTGDYPKGLKMLFQSLQISESIDDKMGILTSYISIGANYSHQGEYEQSLAYFIKAKQLAESIQNERYILISMLNMGDSYEKINRLDSALLITKSSFQKAVAFNNLYFMGIGLINLGNIYAKKEQDDLAMMYYRNSLPVLNLEHNDESFCESTIGMAKLFEKGGQIDSALIFARKSLEVAVRGGFINHQLNASSYLLNYYESKSIIDSAYVYQKIAIAAKDSLFSQEKIRALQNLSFSENIRQQEIETAASEAEESRKHNIQMSAIGAFIPLFFGVILLFGRRKTKPKTLAFLGLLSLLIFFEFITMIIHPYIEKWTHHAPIYMLLTLVAVASFLVPLHHKLEHWVNEKLAHKKHLEK